MNNRRTTLNTRKATHIQINQREFKFTKLNSNIFSKLKSELIKNGYKMPSIKKKPETFKIRRFCSPTTFRDLKCRMTSPVNYRRNFKNSKKTSRCIPKLSPVNDQMLKDYTHDQMLLIDKISRKVADARSFRNRGFRSPRALSKTLLKETRFSSSCNDCFLRVPNVQSNLDSFITLQNRDAFSIERLRGGNVLLSL